MIIPTVGRVMWFRTPKTYQDLSLRIVDHDEPMCALVVHVLNDHMVNLHVFDHMGVGRGLTSVPIKQDGAPDIPAGHAYAEWMPFQVGQAKAQAGQQAAGTADAAMPPKVPSP